MGGHIVSYADDTAIVFQADSWKNVYRLAEKGLIRVKKWMNAHLLSLNLDKTKFLTFSSSRHDQPAVNFIKIHEPSNHNHNTCDCPCIYKTNCIKYLGLQLDEHLKWKSHVEYIVRRLSALTRKFYQIRDILSRENLRMVYFSLAESLIRYCILIWGGLYQESLKALNIIQRGILKILFKKDRKHSTEALFSEVEVMTVRQLYVCSCLMWMYRNNNGSNDEQSVHYLRDEIVTRHHRAAEVPFFRSSHLQRFVFFQGPKLFNMLPPEIKEISTKSRFKKTIIRFIMSNFKAFDRLFTG